MIKRPDEMNACNKELISSKQYALLHHLIGVVLITLIEVKGGDLQQD